MSEGRWGARAIRLTSRSRDRRKGGRATVALLVVLLGTLLSLAAACEEPPRNEPVDGSGVSGHVVMKDGTGSASPRPSPLPSVRIVITDMETNELVVQIRADGEGRFSADLAPGRYTIRADITARKAQTTPAIATVKRGRVTKVTLVVEPPPPSAGAAATPSPTP